MNKRHLVFALTAAFLAHVAGAGPIAPPAGAIAPTMKTLTEIEPRTPINATTAPGDATSMFKITTPGSYYLTGLLLVGPGKAGIVVACDDVTIDLSGYRIGGIAASTAGISLSGNNRRNIIIRNGMVENIQGDGINLTSGDQGTVGARVEQVNVSECTGAGLKLPDDAVADSISALKNGQYGIYAGKHALLTDCSVTRNGSDGMYAGDGTVVTACTAASNAGAGINIVSGTITRCAGRRQRRRRHHQQQRHRDLRLHLEQQRPLRFPRASRYDDLPLLRARQQLRGHLRHFQLPHYRERLRPQLSRQPGLGEHHRRRRKQPRRGQQHQPRRDRHQGRLLQERVRAQHRPQLLHQLVARRE
ncbi:MAG: right-handed parallel beta-helix repeat-containing protein [Phycisphaerales bacterium]